MKQIDNKERAFALGMHVGGATISAALAAGIVFGLYRPIMAEKARVDAKAEETREFVESRQQILDKAQSLKSTQDHNNRLFQQAMARIPETAQQAQFLKELAELARTCEVAIDRFRPGQKTEKDRYNELEIQLNASATYSSLCHFLAGLETTDRLCRVTKLIINEPEDNETSYSIELTVLVFFAPLDLARERDETSKKS